MNSQETKNTSPVDDAELLKTTISLLKRTMASENYLYTFSHKTEYSPFFAPDPDEVTIKDMFNLGAFPMWTIFNFCDTFGIDPFQIPDQPVIGGKGGKREATGRTTSGNGVGDRISDGPAVRTLRYPPGDGSRRTSTVPESSRKIQVSATPASAYSRALAVRS